MNGTTSPPIPSDVPGFLRGVLAFPCTPVTADGRVDREPYVALLERLLAAGVHGIVPGGSTGEFAYLEEDVRHELVELAVKTVADRVSVTVMTTAHTTAEVVRHAAHAAAAGADAQLLNMHSYFPLTAAEAQAHVAAAAAAAPDLPLVVYNSPSVTGVSFTVEQIARLARIPQVVAVKESTADVNFASRLIGACGDRISVLVGHEALALPLLAVGAVGWMSALANLTPQACVALYDAVTTGDLARARALHAGLEPLANYLQDRHLPVVVKAILARTEAPAGDPVPPLLPLDGAEADEAIAVYRTALAATEPYLRDTTNPRSEQQPAASIAQGALS